MGKCLVTGGGGFIGSHLARHLAGKGWRVAAIDNRSNSWDGNIDEVGVEVVVADIGNQSALEQAMDGVQWVFHEAAMVSVPGSIEDPVDCYSINVQGTLNVLKAAAYAGAERVILASSSAVYGESPIPVSESSPPQPLSPYASSKWAMEQAALMYHRLHGLPVVCLRYFNVYGPRQRPDSMYAAVIPAFIGAMADGKPPTIFGDGEQKRDFVYVDDVVRANVLAAESDGAVGKVLNISGGGAVTINELARILHEIIPEAPAPVHKPPREGDIYFSEAVIKQAWRALGYRPEVALAEGLRSTVEWFRQLRLQTPL